MTEAFLLTSSPAPRTGRAAVKLKAVYRSIKRNRILLACKNRLALFHERAPAFGVVLTLKTAADQALAHLGVEVGRRLEDFADHGLGGTHCQRCIGGQCSRVFRQQRSELSRRTDAVDQSQGPRFVGVDFSGREEQILGRSGTDQVNQDLHRRVAGAPAPTPPRNEEHPIATPDTQIANYGALDSAPHAQTPVPTPTPF